MVKFIFIFLIFANFSTLSNEKIEINADQFTYDKDNTRIYATGNVEILDSEFKLFAEKVFVNNSTRVLSASEDVKIFNIDGTILKAKKIVADQNLNNALILDNYLYIPGRKFNEEENFLRIAAKKVERRNKTWEKMEFGKFTACKLCYNEKEKKYDPPLIQLKAKKIIHDKENLDVKYYDAFFDFKGTSIFYLPYFSHPSPLVKRKSGFLAPNFFNTHFFGFGTDVPYYYPINDYHDVTVTPKFSQKKNPALLVEHRKNFFNGEIKNEISGTIENQKINELKEDKKRGHIKSNGSFNLSSNSYLDYKIHRTTDRNYLNTYKYKYEDTLESNIKVESIRSNNFYSFQSYLFQDLRNIFDRSETPKVLPRVLVELNSDKKTNSLNYNTNFEFANILRTNGNETKKLFFQQKFEFAKYFNDGTFVKPGIYLNGGLYNIEKFQNPKNNKFEFNKFRSNFFPQFSLELSKPYYKKDKNFISIITPKILAVKSNKNGFFREIPDESNVNNFDFDYVDLFNVNRLSGNDRFDASSRIDYGLSFLKKKTYKDDQITLIEVGQSYQLEKSKYMENNSGINDKFSDIVINFRLNPHENIRVNSYLKIDKNDTTIKTAYSDFLIQQKNAFLSISNIKSRPVVNTDGENEIEGKNQFSLKYNQKVTDYWNFTSFTTFDKKNKIKMYNYGAKLKYEDECFGLSFQWTRQFTHNPEDPTSNNFGFLFSIKEVMESDL